MVSTRRKKPVVSAKFIETSDGSDGNDTYQEEEYVSLSFYFIFIYRLLTNLYSSSSDDCNGESQDTDNEEEEAMLATFSFLYFLTYLTPFVV